MSVSTIASLILANTTTNAGTITLPPANQIQGRVITFKDSGGNFVNKALTLACSGADTFEDGTTTKTLRETYGTVQVAASGSKWFIISGTQVNTLAASTIKTAALSTTSISSATATLSSIGLTNSQGSTLSMYQASTFLYFNNFIVAGARVGVGQMFYPAVAATFTVTTFTYTGLNQTFTVPPITTSLTVYIWGAGGGGGGGASTGGAGAYVQGTLTVTPGSSLTIIVGQGGLYNNTAVMYGGGGAGPTLGTSNGACGGGRSAIQYNGTELVDAGGGGGASGGAPGGQTGGYSTYTGNAAAGSGGSSGGQGGGGAIGGAAGINSGYTNAATAGSYLQGGKAADFCGAGGGGYYGGGGGAGVFGSSAYSGGGGSSYTTNANFTLITGLNSPNLANNAPGTAVAYYSSGVAAGGNGSANGGNGLIVLTYYR